MEEGVEEGRGEASGGILEEGARECEKGRRGATEEATEEGFQDVTARCGFSVLGSSKEKSVVKKWFG